MLFAQFVASVALVVCLACALRSWAPDSSHPFWVEFLGFVGIGAALAAALLSSLWSAITIVQLLP